MITTAVIVLILIGAVLLTGWLAPSVSYVNRVEVRAPVEKAFAVFTEGENLERWLVGLQHVEPVRGKVMERGSIYRLTFDRDGQEAVITEEVTERVPNRLFAFDMKSGPLSGHYEIRFEALSPEITRITARHRSQGNGLLMGVMAPFLKSLMQEEAQRSYERLKSLIEQK